MEKTNQRIVREDFNSEALIIPGYENFMQGLLEITKNQPINNKLGEQLKSYTLTFLKEYPLKEFNRFSSNNYVREYIGRDSSGWEAIVMSWKKGNVTSIHTHPQFAAYNFADGEFLVEIFQRHKDGLRLENKLIVNEQIGLFAIGEPDEFTNHIHRITCLSENGHSLHIYSDDALKGAKLDDLKIYTT